MNETAEKKYELRALQSKDVWPMVKIVKTIGLKEFRSCFDSDDVRKMIKDMQTGSKTIDETSVGLAVMFDIADVIIEHIADAEVYIYQLLSQLSGISKKELETIEMNTFFEMIIDVIKKDEFKDFMKVVSGFAK